MFAPKTDSIRLFVGGGVRRGGKGLCIVWITDKKFSVFRIGRGRFFRPSRCPFRRFYLAVNRGCGFSHCFKFFCTVGLPLSLLTLRVTCRGVGGVSCPRPSLCGGFSLSFCFSDLFSILYIVYRDFPFWCFLIKRRNFCKKQAAPRFLAGRQKKTAAKSGGKTIVSDFLRSLPQAEVPPRRGQRKGFLSAVPLRRRGRGRGRGAFLPSTRRARPSRPPLSSCGA